MAESKFNTLINTAIFKKKQPKQVEHAVDETDIHSVVKHCRLEIEKSKDSGIMPSPRFFEQAAILSRKQRNYDNEIAICDLYVKLAKDFATKNKLSNSEFREDILPQCESLYKRMHNAKSLQNRVRD